MPLVSVLMPTYGQAGFIPRAVESLLAQSLIDWELIVVDDASPDGTCDVVQPYLADPRIRYLRLQSNVGLGAALNQGLERCASELVGYLPSDDLYYREHLASLLSILEDDPLTILAYAGARHHYNRQAEGVIEGHGLQLVQTVHRMTGDRWVDRNQLVTDDLDRMFWSILRARGPFKSTGRITCEWVDHPGQRHKLLREPIGGINPYRVHFKIRQPLRFHSSTGNLVDEVALYRRFRERPDTPPAADGLKILLLGELAYNPERVLALEEQGHRLYGLWMRDPYWYNTVGPLPFGHVIDLPRNNWRDAVRKIKPDVIYALLNWQAVPFVHEVLRKNPGIPFVWHFKEGPFICLEKGTWPQLLELYKESDGQIYCSPEMRDWFQTIAPGLAQEKPSLVLDGDLPKCDWFGGERSPRLSQDDKGFHTVVPGRPIGLHPETVAELARLGIHLHFYGDFTHGQWLGWIRKASDLAPGYLHLHPQVDQADWVSEFSRYDAGWLHFFRSDNQGEIRRANWDDLNYPARLGTLAVSGLPMLQRDNRDSLVATQTLVKQMNIGLFFDDMKSLREQLEDRKHLSRLRENVWRQRNFFTFDQHVGRLVDFFRSVMKVQR